MYGNKWWSTYTTTQKKNEEFYSHPRKAGVQIAAAFTACARLDMYPFTSREDCYYTDKDSVVLKHPLPEVFVQMNLVKNVW